jgi:hypothetical protein
MTDDEHKPESPEQRVARKLRKVGELALDELRRRGMTEEEIQAFLSRKRRRGRQPRA